MEMEALNKLSAEQLAALNDEQKAIFCALVVEDQDFYARTFKPADLPAVLQRKGEILQRYAAERERMQKLKAFFTQSAEARPPVDDGSEDALAMAAMGVLGIGEAVSTDGTARYRGVRPEELTGPLRAEFGGGSTTIAFTGRPEALIGTVGLLTSNGAVPALTINLTQVDDAVEVKVNDLTTVGVMETVKRSAQQLLNAAWVGFDLLRGRVRSPGDFIDKADRAISAGTGLADLAGNLRLKERAWKAVKQAGEAIEKHYLSELQEERENRYALEKSWDEYENCPTCGVSFEPEAQSCRVCATARPARPTLADPRKQVGVTN